VTEYKVRWKNTSSSDDSWVVEHDLECDQLVKEYLRYIKSMAKESSEEEEEEEDGEAQYEVFLFEFLGRLLVDHSYYTSFYSGHIKTGLCMSLNLIIVNISYNTRCTMFSNL